MPMQPRVRRRRWTIAGIVAAIVAVVGFVAVAALNGIIGNRADSFVLWLIDQMSRIKDGLLPWPVVLIIVLIWLSIISYCLWKIVHLRRRVKNLERESRILQHALSTEHNIVLLDDSLLRLLASWIPSRDHINEMKLILSELLSDATVEFNGHVHRAVLLRPEGEYLKVWAHYGMPEDS